MIQIVTRKNQISTDVYTNLINEDLIYKSKLYPGLLPYFRLWEKETESVAYTKIELLRQSGTPLNSKIKLCIHALYSILEPMYNCKMIVNTKTTIPYIVPYDRRIGVIAIETSKTSFPEPYKIPAKHRFDLDLLLDAPTTEEALKHLYSYASQIVTWINSFNFSNNIVVYDEANRGYKELIIDGDIPEVITHKSIQQNIHIQWVGLKYDDLIKYINMSPYKDLVNFYTPTPVNKIAGDSNVLKL